MAEHGPDSPRPSVDADLRVILEAVLDAGARGRRTVLTLTWHRDDPLAVAVELAAQPDHPALPRGSWVVLRDYLRSSLSESVGDGAVHLRPDQTRDLLWLELERYGRPACVSVPRPSVAAFLGLTDQQVPRGAEDAQPSMDKLLKGLLEEH